LDKTKSSILQSLQSQLAKGVELFIDLLCGTSHPLTSKPILKAAREGITIQAMCFVVAECKKSTAWRGLELQKNGYSWLLG
jgi:hypothetical protein